MALTRKNTGNKNTLTNTDTGITQAFNKLFVQVKVDCRPLRKKEEWGNKGESWGMQEYKGERRHKLNYIMLNRHLR